MDLTDKKYPIYMDLVQMSMLMDMYNEIGSTRVWRNKDRKERLKDVVQEMRIIYDDWLSTRNKWIQDQIDSGKWDKK